MIRFNQARRSLLALAAMAIALTFAMPQTPASAAGPKPKFKLVVSIYAGWMPWYYANETGLLQKWADKYNIDIEVEYMSYPDSLDKYNGGKADACVMTNMECLDVPAAAGVDTSAIIMGDYSNGNDAILVRNNLTLAQLKGKEIALCEKTVSQYLLSRALETVNLSENDVNLSNVSDTDIQAQFLGSSTQKVVVTWNPMVMGILQTRGVTNIFDSSKIPGEIQDLCVVNTKVLKAHPDFGRALVGAWYEMMGIMSTRGQTSEDALQKMADLSNCSKTEFKSQLRTTAMFYTAKSAVDFTNSQELKDKQELVRQFCFSHNLLGENAPSVDVVGIAYPDGTIQGDKSNVKMRYVSTFMQEYADGKITR